jgi:putative serine protease PepD
MPVTTAAPERGRRRIALPVAVVALTLTSAFAGGVVANALQDDDKTPSTASSLDTPAEPVSSNSGTASQQQLTQAAKKALRSVVSIVATDGQQTGEGSGVVISSDGLILTNNHVVEMAADGAGKLTVTLPDGSKESATIKGRDTASDLAVIKVDGHSDLTPATFGKSGDLQVGQTVLAVGSPLGLEGSVTSGIVSALDRAITLGTEQQPNSAAAVIDAIQTDAAINPGNSGGPLVDTNGNVVGINTAIASLQDQSQFGGGSGQGGNIGVGFAIPIDEARTIADQLVDHGSATHAYLGVKLADTDNGVSIGGIVSGGPADKAGLKEGDLVTKIGNDKVDDVASLTAKIRAHKPGDKVSVTVKRDGKTQTVDITLGTYPAADS